MSEFLSNLIGLGVVIIVLSIAIIVGFYAFNILRDSFKGLR